VQQRKQSRGVKGCIHKQQQIKVLEDCESRVQTAATKGGREHLGWVKPWVSSCPIGSEQRWRAVGSMGA